MKLTQSEEMMWDSRHSRSERARTSISERYAHGEGRIVIETNRERLPHFIRSLQNEKYLDLRPFYQRRSRWVPEKQSLLIESFVMNIPVPPVFLYERDYGQYEVMDGQQRLTALRDFYDGRLTLVGLETWPELNGYRYDTLPSSIRAALDRRSISSVVVLKESTGGEDEANFIREAVFERLNTGGVELSTQEIRNALYQSDFNEMIKKVADWSIFRGIWQIPQIEYGVDYIPERLAKNRLFSKMEDVELVLRFFALRHVDHYSGGMRGFLDNYMRRAMEFSANDVRELENLIRESLAVSFEIFGAITFHPYSRTKNDWANKPHKAFYDSVILGVCRRIDNSSRLIARRTDLIALTRNAFLENDDGIFTGRGNSKRDIINRIELFDQVLESVL